MTTVVFPVNAVTGSPSYSGRSIRQTLGALWFGHKSARPLGVRSGVPYGTPTNTVQSSSFTWTVKPHQGVLDVQTSAVAGPYFYAVTADETGSINAAHATLPRVDIISVRVDDPQDDATSVPLAAIVYTAGTAAASPVAPSTATTRELILATIAVPASGGGNPVVTWAAPYTVAAGGIIPVRTTTERASLYSATGASTDAPIFTWRKDATAGNGLEYTTDGTIVRKLSTEFPPWANAAARAAQTGMIAGDTGYQTDTAVTYYYDGSSWLANQPGLNLIIPTSVSGSGVSVSNSGTITLAAASSASINGCFTSRFTNYQIFIDITTSGNSNVQFVLRASGADASTGYDVQLLRGVSTVADAAQSLNGALWPLSIVTGASFRHVGTIDLAQPAVAVGTVATAVLTSTPNPMTTSGGGGVRSLQHRTTTAYDGFTVSASTGTLTGTIQVYGRAK